MPFLLEPDAFNLLKSYDIPIPDFKLINSEEKISELTKEMNFPIVMKIVSPDILHKTEAGGVKIDIKNEEEARIAFQEIVFKAKKYNNNALIYGVIVYPMIPSGIETIIGIGKDPEFGKYIMFGLGGIYVEVFKDVSFRLIPLEIQQVKEMISEIKGSILFSSYRSRISKNVNALVDIILKCSKFGYENGEINSIDLNPVILGEKDAIVVDARIEIKK
jgi:acyl-CoA synthetase (NDP forming)